MRAKLSLASGSISYQVDASSDLILWKNLAQLDLYPRKE
jgi:hypothetical protein